METREEMEEELVNYFETIITKDRRNRSKHIEKISRHVPNLITQSQNDLLMNSMELQEVTDVVYQMEEGNAPGLDGLTTNLFHHFWDLIKIEVWQVMEDSHTNRGVLWIFNSNFISLIPKQKELIL